MSYKIIQFVKSIARGQQEILELGDISVEKEWTFAGDVVKGILTLVQQDILFETVIGSGMSYSIQNWLEECFRLIDQDWRNYVKLKEGFTSEYKRLVSNPKLINSLGWFPVIDFSQLALMMMNNKF